MMAHVARHGGTRDKVKYLTDRNTSIALVSREILFFCVSCLLNNDSSKQQHLSSVSCRFAPPRIPPK